MDGMGTIAFEDNIKQLTEAIQELSKQVKKLKQAGREESEKLKKYEAEEALLEFVLVTSGIIKGKILWVGNQSIGVRTDSDQNVILYKHAIAFIQKGK